jgi:hypothetical protein
LEWFEIVGQKRLFVSRVGDERRADYMKKNAAWAEKNRIYNNQKARK